MRYTARCLSRMSEPCAGNNLITTLIKYVGGLNEMFPRVNKKRLVETSIERKYSETILSAYASGNNISNAHYCEFRVPSTNGHLKDFKFAARGEGQAR